MRSSGTRSWLPILVALAQLLLAGAASSQPAQPAPAEHHATPAPTVSPALLTLWNRPIIEFRIPIGPVSPAERAAGAARRFGALPRFIRADEITARPATYGEYRGVVITAGDVVLFGITEGDVDPTSGETVAELSERAVASLRGAVDARAEQRRPAVLLRGLGLSLGAGVLLVLILWAIRRAAHRILLRLADATHRRAVSLVGVDLRRPIDTLERGVVRVTAWCFGAVAAYLWVAYALNQFPYTRPWSARLRADIVARLADLGTEALLAIPGVLAVVVIFLAARFAIRLLDLLFQGVERDAVKLRSLPSDTAGATRRIASVLIWILALTMAYQYIPGSGTDAFRAIGVLTGLMISLGSAGLVNQLMSGLVVVYSRALRPGEIVRVGDLAGRVTEVGLLSTKLAAKGEEITIPNAVLVGTTVTNYSRLGGDNGPVIATSVGIGYDAPWRQVHAMLLLAAARTPGIRAQPAPFVLQRALTDFVVEYELRGHLERSAEPMQTRSALHMQIQDAFNEFGVQIMAPAFESQPERPVVVPRARWYATPAAPPKDGAPPHGESPAASGDDQRV